MDVIDENRLEHLKELELKLGYVFCNRQLLNRALTHSSYANQYGLSYIEHNERLEFLGDSVLSLMVSEYLFNRYSSNTEGKLTRMRAGIVCEASLYEQAKKLGIGEYMLVGKGEELTGGRERISVLADSIEALIAAIYIDGGLDNAKKFILSLFSSIMDNVTDDSDSRDYKSRLQEYVQKDQGMILKYEVENEEGPAHNRVFFVKLNLSGRTISRGSGKSKKEAEQAAAKGALEFLGDSE